MIKGGTMQELNDEKQYDDFLQGHPAAAIWFSAPDCNVCHVLLPKVAEMLQQEFPCVALAKVDCAAAAVLAASHNVLTIPTLLLAFDGHEAQRFVRNFGIGQVREALIRPYGLMFE